MKAKLYLDIKTLLNKNNYFLKSLYMDICVSIIWGKFLYLFD